MPIERNSHCKVNLLLNILGRQPSGFHELETVMVPVAVHDHLRLEKVAAGLSMTCSHPNLPVDSSNLVFRAAERFLHASKVNSGLKIHLEKRIPLAAGLGGGSGNAAATLLAANELFGKPLADADVYRLACGLGSDVPFFLQEKPALATGRGERIEAVEPFRALAGRSIVLIHPGFGISTAWAYQQLAHFPAALNGRSGRARELVAALHSITLSEAAPLFYNSLEAPALAKYPVLALYQEFLKANGALAALMSGSGSTTFAVTENQAQGERLLEKFGSRFGDQLWAAVVPL